MQGIISHWDWLSLIVNSSTSQKIVLKVIPCIFLPFEGYIIWTGIVGPVMSLSVEFIDLYFICQKSSHRFLLIFSQLLRTLFSLKFWNKKWGSPCLFKRKGAFTCIWLSSLVWGKSLTFCTCTCWCLHANEVKIMRSRDAQCRESP